MKTIYEIVDIDKYDAFYDIKKYLIGARGTLYEESKKRVDNTYNGDFIFESLLHYIDECGINKTSERIYFYKVEIKEVELFYIPEDLFVI